MEVCPDSQVEMSNNDMKSLGVQEGQTIKITGPNNVSVNAAVKRSRRATDGTIIIAPHFQHLKVNSFLDWNAPVIKVKIEKVA